MTTTLLSADISGLKHIASGKVRDIFDLGAQLLIVTTDRISAFDVILPNGIPHKGAVLTAISEFWFRFVERLGVKHHLITCDISTLKLATPNSQLTTLLGRSMLVKKATPFPVECVVRGYLAGSGWKDYQRTGAVCGITLPNGLRESDKFAEPIFTPATKAQTGHDENISFDEMVKVVGRETAETLKKYSITIYKAAADYARMKGIIICDTKFEFGLADGEIILIDEVLTPDSSRFWPLASYEPGRPQPSFDKQFVRDYLERIRWDKKPPAPELPDDIVKKTSEKYLEAYRLLTGEELITIN